MSTKRTNFFDGFTSETTPDTVIVSASGLIGVWQGEWTSQDYVENDAVYYEGSSYICILDTTAMQDPTDATYWELAALKGEEFRVDETADLDEAKISAIEALPNIDAFNRYFFVVQSDTRSNQSLPAEISGDQSLNLIQWDGTAWTTVAQFTGDQGIQGIQGPQGIQGVQGDPGEGVPSGGTTGQILDKVDGTDYNTQWTDTFTGNKTFANDVTITGDLTVNGTTTNVNTTNLDVTDANITVNNGGDQASANLNNAGLTVEMSDATDAVIGYDSTAASKFKVGESGSEEEVATTAHTQTLTNKTIDADNNTISNLEHGAEVDDPSSGVHGVTGNVVGTTDTQTLSDKTLTEPVINGASYNGGTASATNYLKAPEDTTANLTALPRKAGAIYWSTDELSYYGDDGTSLVPIGAGGGSGAGLNFYADGNAEDLDTGTSEFTSGNSATFDDSGSLVGAVNVIDTPSTEILNGAQSFKYVQAASGSTNDWWHTGAFIIPAAYRGRFLELTFQSNYDGADGDIEVRFKDDTNSNILALTDPGIKAYTGPANNNAIEKRVVFWCPENTASVKIGFQVVADSANAVFRYDDITLAPPVDITEVVQDEQTMRLRAAQNTFVSLANTGLGFPTSGWIESGELLISRNVGASSRTEFTANVDCLITLSISVQVDGAGSVIIFDNTGTAIHYADLQSNASAYNETILVDYPLAAGEYLYIRNDSGTFRNTGNECYTTVSAKRPLNAFKAESRVPENVFSARIQNNGTASIKSQGASFFGTPTRNSAGNVTVPWLETLAEIPSVTATFEGSVNDNGISVVSVSTTNCVIQTRDSGGVVADLDFNLSVVRQGFDYRDPVKAFIQFNEICYLNETQTFGTLGGTFTSGADQTRTLNTLKGNVSWCTLNGSNQFTLAPGTYEFDFEAPAYQVNGHKAWIYNVTDLANTDLEGRSCYTGVGDVTNDYCRIRGTITITSVKTFELRHRCQTTKLNEGYGTAAAVTGFGEIYSNGSIKRIG